MKELTKEDIRLKTIDFENTMEEHVQQEKEKQAILDKALKKASDIIVKKIELEVENENYYKRLKI